MVVLLIYASQTGTAEEVSRQLEMHLSSRATVHRLSAADVCLKQLMDWQSYHNLVLFFVATTGDGEPPDSLFQLWGELLDSSLQINSLAQLQYSLFGFGDSKYGDKYNAMARKLDQRLGMLGAKKAYVRGLGDEQDPLGYRLQYEQWRDGLFKHLHETSYPGSVQLLNARHKQTFETRISWVKPLVTGQFGRQTFEVALETEHKFSPGDVVNLRPENESEVVSYFLSYFKVDAQDMLKHRELEPMPAGQLFQHELNLSDTVPFSFWHSIEGCLPKAQSREQQIYNDKLRQLSSDFGQYKSYIKDSRRSLKDVLEDFPLRIPLEYLLSHINLLTPRQYSIASAARPNQVLLLVRLLEKQLTPYRTVKGLLSHQITSPDAIGKLKTATLTRAKLPYQQTAKYILVGIGTGVAPLLSIIRQRSREPQWDSPSIALYFGNQTAEEIYYRQELDELNSRRTIRLRTAVSREPPRQHVQDLLREDSEYLRSLADGSTCIYICGTNYSFAKSIAAMLVSDILGQNEKEWRHAGRLLTEFW